MSDSQTGPAERKEDPAPFPSNAVHVIRTAQAIHVNLSAMADNKANILLAATFLIFTLALGDLHEVADPLPLMILAGSSFVSSVVCIFAVLPALGHRKGGPINLLFFGSFTQMDEEAYVTEVVDNLRTDERGYRMMARDLYQNGVVLARKKYRLLGWAYRIFLVGLLASGMALVWSYLR